MDERKQPQECITCRARAFANTVDDANLRDALIVFAPQHTCSEAESAAESAPAPAPTAEAAEAQEAKEELSALKTLDVIAFNQNAERRFIIIASSLVPCSINELVRECAYALDISTETVKRYLLKHSARNAEFEITQNIVRRREKMSYRRQTLEAEVKKAVELVVCQVCFCGRNVPT